MTASERNPIIRVKKSPKPQIIVFERVSPFSVKFCGLFALHELS